MGTASLQPAERALIVEDDSGLRRLLADEVRDGGLDVRTVTSVEEAQPLLTSWEPDVVVSDLRLPGANAFALLREARSLHAPPAFVVITAFGSVPQAVEALKAGADDFLTKPLDLDHFMLSVTRSLEARRLKQEVRRFRELLGSESFHGIIGQSRPMRVLFDHLRQVAGAGGPVLITGESGVGKELVAHAIHREGPRAGAPFLAVNCVAIPEQLMESELFGHAAGAFTGATRARKGLFTEADHGTVLLDEIAEMPLTLQAKLLRFLQDGGVRPLGSNQEQCVDVRILAATNRDLKHEVTEGRFREDLFYRLETFTLRVPPLRERGDDLDLLARHFLTRFSMQMDKHITGLSAETLQRLKEYPFPGNVRELKNVLERAVTFCQGSLVSLEHLPGRIRETPPAPESVPQTGLESPENLLGDQTVVPLAELEQRYIRYVLGRVNGNKRRAAALLGIGRRTLYRRLGESETGEEGG